MANGLETFVTLTADGSIAGYEPFPDDAVATKVLSPLRFARLAGWAQPGRLGLALTRNGEVLVFAGGNLSFARRRGVWHYLPHRAIIDRMRLNTVFARDVVKAVYETCLDVSFARTGGGIGLIRKERLEHVIKDGLIDAGDRLEADTAKGRFLRAVVKGKKFQALDRRLRQDLVAIDGDLLP